MREREIRVGFERAPEVRLGACDRRKHTVGAVNVGVACGL
jgi:hypothetical protein